MTLRSNKYYNILVSRYGNDDGKVVESRWYVSIDSLSDWLSSIDFHCCEVLIRDIESIQFDSAITPPSLFCYGD